MGQDCIFCKIAEGEIPSDILYRDDVCFVIRDIAPAAPVHLLVIPNEHFTYLDGLMPDRHRMVGAMFQAAAQMAVREGISKSGYRLSINQGDDSGQMVDHLNHLFYKPRVVDDTTRAHSNSGITAVPPGHACLLGEKCGLKTGDAPGVCRGHPLETG